MAARHFTDEELVAMIDNDNDGDDDRDPDFEPNEKEDGFSSSEEDQPADKNIPHGETNRSRRRIRDPVSWKKNIRKRARNTGEEYTSLSSKKIPKKTLDHTDCVCKRKCCQKISQLRRLQLHESFWALGDWTAQNSFLVGLVKKSPVKRHDERDRRDRKQEHFVGPILTRPKQITRHYFLSNSDGTDIQVCKAFFLKTFSVSNGRLCRALEKAIVGGSPISDQRGRHEPGNKTETQRTYHLKNFLEEIPKYESHYTRTRHVDKTYLAPGLTLIILYDLYKERCVLDSLQPVSDWKFRSVFKIDFANLSFHQPMKDTCKTCDLLAVQIQEAEQTRNNEKFAEKDKDLHLRRAEASQTSYKTNCEKTKTEEVTVFCYDLQKTLPTPVLTTGVVYYKRQMWVYNLGIHDAKEKNGYMYMWDESKGSRGPNEIASCLYKHLLLQKPNKCVIAYADTCGGQNRNIKIALFWTHVVQNPEFNVEIVHQKFFVSGHSWMDSDKDFAVIEKAKRSFSHIYVPDDWVEVVKKSKKNKPFVVTTMEKQDLKNIEALEKAIVNRKVDTDGVKVEWLKIHWLRLKRSDPKKIFFKYSHNEDLPFRCIDISRVGSAQNLRNIDNGSVHLPVLYPNG